MKVFIPTLKQDQRPLYAQVSDVLSELILSNAYMPGEKLPSEEDLALQLGVSRPTLRVAIGYLESQGLLERRRGIGTFIAHPREKQVDAERLEEIETICETAERTGLTYERVHWHIEKTLTNERLADLLKTAVNKPVIYARYAFKLSGRLYAFFESWVLESHVDFDTLKAYPQKGLLDYLWECCPENFSSTQTNIFARVADAKISGWVGIPEGTPLLHMEELFILDNGQPFVYNLKYFDTDILHFYMSRRFSDGRQFLS
ncbi:MAG: GntR family transcriptional regulator [Anaerolineaceae bacterium]|nr:GntR family transcriptional regulator [Anaerolineaceae bacterium]